jgi:hypothetical protein
MLSSSSRTRPLKLSTNGTLPMHRGGIRRTVFGTANGLTKVPLVFVDDVIETFVEWHHVRNGRLADTTCVLRHHPFVSTFYAKVEEAARSGRYGAVTSDEYRAYWAVLERAPDLSLRRDTAVRFIGVDQLVALGFLQESEKFRLWVVEHRDQLIGPDGAGEADDGGFYCTEWRFTDEEL